MYLCGIYDTEVVEVNEYCCEAQHILVLNEGAGDREGVGVIDDLTPYDVLALCKESISKRTPRLNDNVAVFHRYKRLSLEP